MKHLTISQTCTALFYLLCLLTCCCLLAGCDLNGIQPGVGAVSGSPCQSNCALGPGAGGLHVIIEPDAGPAPLVDAIREAQHSVWLEMYLLSNKSAIAALEDDANRGLDVRVMLEPHPYGGGALSPQETLAKLQAAGVKAQYSSPAFALTHEKGLIIDGSVAYIMTSNFTNTALGTGNYTKNREYDIVDANPQDVQAVEAIFQADWNHTTASFNAPNLVVSPLNSRSAFNMLIASAKHTLLVTAEEMQDSGIEQDLVAAAQRGVNVQVILPTPGGGSSDSNSNGIASIKQAGVNVREDPRLYMHAKILIIDGQTAFVGSENISAQSLDQTSRRRNR
jgi:phosphatidylserine/phosphatidylglycerophosphate/cardiolipin synthase-like enzyme